MEFELLNKVLLNSLKIRKGNILSISSEGEIKVINDEDELPILCEFLRTSAGPIPELKPGANVLYVIDELTLQGYVLGIIQKYVRQDHIIPDNGKLYEPEKKYMRIKLNAKERVEICCGKSSITMTEDGNVYIKGNKITSRAREANKIKGGTVQIN